MELTDFEFEAILKQALSDKTEVPKELNDRLMKKIAAKKHKRHFRVISTKYAAAAAVVAAVGVGAMINGGYFSDKSSNEHSNIAVTDNDSSSKKTNPQNSDSPKSEYADSSTDEAVKQAGESKSTAADFDKKPTESSNKTAASKNNAVKKSEKDNKNTSSPSANKKNDVIIAKSESELSGNAVASVMAMSESDSVPVADDKAYKYLNIAADGIGKALESLNILANNSIEDHYLAFSAVGGGANAFAVQNDMASDTVLFSAMPNPNSDADSGAALNDSAPTSKRSSLHTEAAQVLDTAENTESLESESITPEQGTNDVIASYEVMADTDNYYSVRVDAVSDVGYIDEYSAHFTVDKNKESIVSLDDIYSGIPEYKEKLYDSICSQMNQRMKENENVTYYIGSNGFENVSGNEDFYMNELEEVVITYEKGTVAPYEQGESVFNVGRADELNTRD